ncbi:hypothetical protein ABRY59_25010, partial [Ralstonia pseudosolanacearum]
QQRLQCLPQFIADLLSCHANNNAQPPAFDDLVLLATLSSKGPNSGAGSGRMARTPAPPLTAENLLEISSLIGLITKGS